jgi:hypothetical protein
MIGLAGMLRWLVTPGWPDSGHERCRLASGRAVIVPNALRTVTGYET